MKRVIALWMALMIVAIPLLACADEAEEDEPEYYTLYVMCRPNSYVNVRTFPKKSRGSVVGRLECGDEVKTLGEKSGQYVKIYGATFETSECWIHAGYLADSRPEIWEDGKRLTVMAKGRVALRRYMRGKRRAWIRPGKTVMVYAMTDEWALTNRGYVKAEYLAEE